jgi:PPK2 family polyphosphate:nucleotide phosphotransferase
MGREGTTTLRDRLRVDPGTRLRLADLDPRETFGHEKVDAGDALLASQARLAELHDRFWADGRHRLLVILQGIDTAGKGGTIEHVMGAFAPQGVRVKGYGVPTPVELAHDYLWRVHPNVPGNGEIAIFDRSHYEDVLVVRVHELVPKARWSRRYDQINAFERLLVEEGTTIVKCFLHISKEEQRDRLQARLDDPSKRWKFRLGDLDERKRWDRYVAAHEEMLTRCSTPWAPWYVIPSDRKWFRNLAVSELLVDVLEGLDSRYPPVDPDVPTDLVVE